jgi:hypothetical protein
MLRPTKDPHSRPAMNALERLHSELGGQIFANKTEAVRLRTAMMQVEAVMKMLAPDFDVSRIAPKRRNTGNPWFKRGTLYRSAVDMLRTAQGPMTSREIVVALLASKGVTATREQSRNLEAGIRSSLDNHEGKGVVRVGEGMPARWQLCFSFAALQFDTPQDR